MDGDARFNQDPFEVLGTIGPPTRFQPQYTGQGYKTYVFESSPVAHVLSPDYAHHQMIRVHPEDAHLPVERELLDYIKETGYNPAEFHLPEHETTWVAISEQFGFPDSRPGSTGQWLPTDYERRASGDLNPGTGFWPGTRDQMDSSRPHSRRPGLFQSPPKRSGYAPSTPSPEPRVTTGGFWAWVGSIFGRGPI